MQSHLISVLLVMMLTVTYCRGFTSTAADCPSRLCIMTPNSCLSSRYSLTSTTVISAPTKEDVDRKTRRRSGSGNDDDLLGNREESFDEALRRQGPLEWLEDMEAARDMDDPFHILLLGQTFEKPKITVPYVASSLEYVLDMPVDEALELAQFSHDNGISCLGVWPRQECLRLGKQLQIRDIVCRVVPFCEGGHRAWQAKDASSGVSRSSE
jgi:hypothetical protein